MVLTIVNYMLTDLQHTLLCTYKAGNFFIAYWSTFPRGSCRIVIFGLFKVKKTNLTFFKLAGFEIFENLSSSWPFFKSIEVSIVKSKNFSFLKTEFGIFQLQAADNPGLLPSAPEPPILKTF